MIVSAQMFHVGFGSYATWAARPHPVCGPPRSSGKGRNIGNQDTVNDYRTRCGHWENSRTGKRYLINGSGTSFNLRQDRRLFWSRDFVPMPGGCYHHDAEGYERPLCKCPYLFSSPKSLSKSSYLDQVPQEAFLAAAKSVRRQITPAVLQKFAKWRDGTTARQF